MGINRISPQLPVEAVKTYSVLQPIPTHFRTGSCAEARCPNMQYGWRSTIDERYDLGRAQAHYIRKESGRRFTEILAPSGLTEFTFQAGQTCFAQHSISLDREPLYIVRGGDWRGNPRGETRRHVNGAEWVEDFAEHQQTLADRLAQG